MFDPASGAPFQHDMHACVVSISIATPEGFLVNLCFPFEVGFSLVKPSLFGRWEVENDFGRESPCSLCRVGDLC